MAVVLGIVSSAIILFFGFKTHPANQPLGIGQLSISMAVFVSFSLVAQLIVHWPYLYRLGNVFVLIFIPMPYGYAWFGTFVPQKDRIWLHEKRIYEQAQYTHSKGKVNLVHRIRIEHRWRQQFLDISLDKTDVLFTNRYRYLFQLDGPIKRDTDRTTNLRWQVANEFFIHNKEEVGYMLFDQNRTLAGMMISPKGNMSLALLYQLIIPQQPLLRVVQTIDSFIITLFHKLDLPRRKKENNYEVPVIDKKCHL